MSAERNSKNSVQQRNNAFSPPPSGPISPRDSSLSYGHNALTDLRRVSTDSNSSPHNRSAPLYRNEHSGAELAARFSRSADRKNYFPRETDSNFRQNDGSNRIPLTGDKETDANILAFIKARDTILQEQTGKFLLKADYILIFKEITLKNCISYVGVVL